MIDESYGKYTLICDICGEELGTFETWEKALKYVKENGWEGSKGERLDLAYGYIDICPNCGGRR